MKKKLLYIFGILLIGLSILFLFANSLAEKYLSEQLNQLTKKHPTFSYKAPSISLLKGKLSLNQLHFNDSGKGITLQVKNVTVEGISFYQLIVNQQLKIGKLYVNQPSVERFETIAKKDSTNSKDTNNPKEPIAISIEKLKVIGANYRYSSKEQFMGINLLFDDLNFKSDSFNIKSLVKNLHSFSIDSSYFNQPEFHTLRSKKISYNEGKLSIDSISIKPSNNKKPRYRYTKKDISVQRIECKLDLIQIFKKEEVLSIPSIAVKGLKAELFTNKNRSKKSGQIAMMPHEMIQSVNMPFRIDTLRVTNSDVTYSELETSAKKSGYITFNNMEVTLQNLTNDSNSIANDKMMTAKIQSSLMGRQNLYISIYYDLSSKNGNHSIVGSLKNFDLTSLNSAFEPLAQVKFESGKLNSLDFQFEANNSNSNGFCEFRYENLKVITFNTKKIKRPRFLSKLENILVNTLIVRKSNPLRGDFKEGKIQFTRDKKKSFLNFWWKSTFSGMKSTMLRIDQ